MRLTLRTLLAYLDDLLEPAQAKELGAKIQESDVASELVLKIREVIRKRRLMAPVVHGPGCDLDANTVAEYLDNTLPPDGVTELEQLCLDSDMHLAEVAACHQILTLVLGEPVDIGAHSRDRMYALGQASAAQMEFGATTTRENESVPPTSTAVVSPEKPSPSVTATKGAASPRVQLDVELPAQRGDSFIGKAQSGTIHPSAQSPAKDATASSPTANHGQNATNINAQSATTASPAPASSHSPGAVTLHPKPTATAPAGLSPAVKPVSNPKSVVAASMEASPQIMPMRESHPTESVDRTIPDYLKSKPVWRRAWPVALLVLLGVWGFMLVKDKDLLSDLLGKKPVTQVAENDQLTGDAGPKTGKPSAETTVNADNNSQGTQAEAKSDLESGNSAAETKAAKPQGTEVAAIDPGVDAPPPAEQGDTEPSTKAGPSLTERETTTDVPDTVPMETKLPNRNKGSGNPNSKGKTGVRPEMVDDSETTPDPTPAAQVPGKQVASNDPAEPTETDLNPGSPAKTLKPIPAGQTTSDNRPKPARYVSSDGVMLRFDEDREGWFPLPHNERMFIDDILAVPEPFDAQIQFGVEKHRLTAIGPTLFQAVDMMNDFPLGISVERGRLVLQPAEMPAGADMPPRMKLAVSVQGLTWLLELPDVNSRCGVEIIPREPRQLEENFGSHGWSGKLYVASGTVKITTPEGKATILSGPETYVLAPDPNVATAVPVSTGVMPAWLGERKLSSVAKLNATQFQRTLLQDELSAHDALLAAVTDRVPEKSRLATACLGLIGDYQMMLEILDRNEHHESREAAIMALRSWVNLNPVNREKLQTELSLKFIKEHAATIYRLIWGYQEQDLQGKQVSRQLVNQLEHDSLAVRELSCYYIKLLTNRRLDYDARGPLSQRNAAIQLLNKVLSKDDTLLPALPKGAGFGTRRN